MTTKIRGSQQIQAGTVGAPELAASGASAGEYGDASNIPVLTVDADGRITAISEVAAGGGVSDGDKGDVTVSSSGTVWTIDNDVVSNAKLANMAQDTIKGRATNSTGDPEDLTSLPFAFTGDVTRAADSNAQTIANDAVTYAKMQNVSAASKLLGRGSAGGAGDPEEITLGTNLSMAGTTLNASGGGSAEYPAHASMWMDETTVLVGTTHTTNNQLSSQRYLTVTQNDNSADGDSFTISFIIAAGTYTFFVLGMTENDMGILDWYVDDVAIVTGQDWYSGGVVLNVVKSQGSIVLTEGSHVLKGVINGKNASSTDFFYLLTKFWFK